MNYILNHSNRSSLPDLSAHGFSYSKLHLVYRNEKAVDPTPEKVILGSLNICFEVVDDKMAHYLALEITPVNAPSITITISSTDLGNSKKIEAIAYMNGLLVYNSSLLRKYCLLLVSELKKNKQVPRQIVSDLGWFQGLTVFNTGKQLVHSESIDSSLYHHQPLNVAYLSQQGNLADWQAHIFNPASGNPMILGAMCIGLSALLYEKLDIPMGIVNYFGQAGTGKTLMLQITGSQFGNSAAPDQVSPNACDPCYIRKFNCTEAGFETMAAQYIGTPLLLDELGEADQGRLGALIYTLSSGQGKNRSTSALKTAKTIKWQTSMIAVGEVSMQSCLEKGKNPVMDGQLDRCADISIDDTTGIFTDFAEFESFQALTGHLKQATGRYYGTAAIAFIKWIQEHPDEIELLHSTFHETVADYIPEGCAGGSIRIIHRFGAALIAGYIAVEAGIYTCNENAIENAIKQTILTWWQGREWAVKLIADYTLAHEHDIIEGKVTRVSAPAFFIENEGLLVIEQGVFEEAFGDSSSSLLASLAARNILQIEQKGRLLKRYCNNRVFAYAIKFEKVEEMIKLMDIDQ